MVCGHDEIVQHATGDRDIILDRQITLYRHLLGLENKKQLLTDQLAMISFVLALRASSASLMYLSCSVCAYYRCDYLN